MIDCTIDNNLINYTSWDVNFPCHIIVCVLCMLEPRFVIDKVGRNLLKREDMKLHAGGTIRLALAPKIICPGPSWKRRYCLTRSSDLINQLNSLDEITERLMKEGSDDSS